ncbi:bicaudal C-like protein 1 [Pitangus sulphuratus]|nr:bicaudal C-like protein 1 [Pitangus sulphuratus]
MAAQRDPLSGYLQQPLSDPGSNSERSADSPAPGSEEDSAGPPRALHSPEWGEERFRVDRKKLEAMLQDYGRNKYTDCLAIQVEDWSEVEKSEGSEQLSSSASGYGHVEDYRAYHKEITLTVKQDPHIKVSGKKENVKEAKERIMSVLDTKVSIAGQPAGVESARVRIRELLPLVLMFELPIAGILQPIPDPNSPTIQHICQTYNISVSFKQRSRMYGATVIVRGSQNNTSAVKEGTAMLLEHLAGSLASAILVSTQLDIAAQHHLFMMGRNGSNIKHIMQRTGAQIHFPDPSNPQKKSTVYLQGTIEAVCLARQYLMGCLPLVLMFDMKEEIEVEPQFITQLMEQLDVFISIKPKPKQPSKSVIVKSVERNALNMYEARKCLLGLESSGVTIASNPSTVSCPVGLSCPGLDILSSAGLGLTGLGFSAIPHLMIPSTAQATLTSILLSGVPNYSQNTPSPPPGLTPVEVHVNGMQSESKKVSPSLNGHVKASNIKYAALAATSLGENVLSANHGDPVRQTSTHGPSEQVAAKSNSEEGCNDAFVEVGMPRSPSHSANTSDLKQMMSSSKQACAKRQTVELLQGTKNSHLHPQFLTAANFLCIAFDYEQKKLLATKAMLKKPVVTEVRTPTNTWSGLGFSKSMPAETIKELRRANHVSYKPSMTTTYEGSSMSLSRSSSREHLGSGSESDNWRDRNGLGPTAHDFVSSIGSPKRKQNKSEPLRSVWIKILKLISDERFLWVCLTFSELNKNRRKLFDPSNIRASFLEGGASGRLPRQYHSDIASVSGRW